MENHISSVIKSRQDSNRNLIESNYITSNRNLIDDKKSTNKNIEQTLKYCEDVIDPLWVKRHAKYCYTFGIPKYWELVEKAKKYGNNPTKLLAYMVNKELSHEQ